VELGGVLADAEAARNALVRQALRHQLQHLQLAGRERLGGGRRRHQVGNRRQRGGGDRKIQQNQPGLGRPHRQVDLVAIGIPG
jgi:hypothetical protein